MSEASRPQDKAKMVVVDLSDFATLSDDEQMEKARELLRQLNPKRQ